MDNYQRMARAVRYLRENQAAQPGLDEVAAHLGLSPSHFHVLFTEWVGVSPKTFLQFLTHQRARQLLLSGQNILDTALDSGLSGPGRLHDLCIKLESASPGEVKNRGAGWTLSTGAAPSPFGPVFIAENPRGICFLAFPEADKTDPKEQLRREWPRAHLHPDTVRISQLAESIFHPEGKGTLRTFVKATPFQVLVWKALLAIPRGSLTTYGRLAAAIGKPGAARAVGSAVGANPISYLIPCHRVIRESGEIGEYRWGSTRKTLLIGRELRYSSAL